MANSALTTSKIVLPKEVTTQLLTKIPNISTIASFCPQTPQMFSDNAAIVFSRAAHAEVVGESNVKGGYDVEPGIATGTTRKIQTTTRVSDELQWADEDNQMEIVNAILEDQAQAHGEALDIIVYHGLNPASGTAITEATSLVSEANVVTATNDPQADIDALADGLEEYVPNGFALSRAYAGELRKVRTTDGKVRVYPNINLGSEIQGDLEGIPALSSNTVDAKGIAKTDTKVKAILGDYRNIQWGLKRSMLVDIITSGDPDGKGDLKRYNQIALRTESVLCYTIFDPKGFAVLKEKVSS